MSHAPKKVQATVDYVADDRPSDNKSSTSPIDVGAKPAPSTETLEYPAKPTAQQIPTVDTAGATPGGDTDFSLTYTGTQPSAAENPFVLAGYEILGVLGHGGMGVVYKARHRELNRVVALKMVLAGAHASPLQLARFRTEAEAVAALQHPNIVQIYEVGQHEGLPYFSLEFVDGGSLEKKLGHKPLPQREAAQLAVKLAQAMQYAHQLGIIHRDLKPANVLLTAGGVPKITDFGLAKRLDVTDSSQTRSGTLMGTPSYMAPEQARGDVKEIGTLADVYSLGAMLYELLTGRPPFQGATLLDTVEQVRSQEPVPPTRLQPKLSRDLETICLKCLQKDPAKRYAHAGALAEDLERYLAGQPILARPVGVPERLWRWCRRNPRIATLSAAVLVLLVTLAVGSTVAAVWIEGQRKIAEHNAEAARVAQLNAEAAQADTEVARQKEAEQRKLADKNAEDARLAQLKAETAQTQTEEARKKAAENAAIANVQRGLALGAFHTLVTKVQSQLQDTPAMHGLKQQLLETALAGLGKVTASADGSALVDLNMAEAHNRMGGILADLGRTKEAIKHYEQFHEITKTLHNADPDSVQARRNLALSYASLGAANLLLGDRTTARLHYEESLKLRLALWQADKEDARARVDLATAYLKLGNISEPEAANPLYQEALKLRAELVKKASTRAAVRDLWIVNLKLTELALRMDDRNAADKYAKECRRLAEAMFNSFPKIARTQRDVAASYELLGKVSLHRGQLPQGQGFFDAALKIVRPLAAKDTEILSLQTEFAVLVARAGRLLEAAERAEQLRKLAPTNAANLYNVACCYALCAAALDRRHAGGQPTPEEQAERKRYADAAVEALNQAFTHGIGDLAAELKTDPDFDAIRQHQAFRALLERGE